MLGFNFGDREAITEVAKDHASKFVAIANLLVQKGVITPEELEVAVNKASAEVDQVWAERKEQALKEFDEEHPGIREIFGKVLGIDEP